MFVVSPHRAQIRAIRRELRRQRRWQSPPLVDTVDKMQGQEADAVIVSYGVSDPEFAAEEAEFIYGLNRLNVAVTRARSKCVVCIPRPLLDAPPQVLDLPEAARGLAFMRELVEAVSRGGESLDVRFGRRRPRDGVPGKGLLRTQTVASLPAARSERAASPGANHRSTPAPASESRPKAAETPPRQEGGDLSNPRHHAFGSSSLRTSMPADTAAVQPYSVSLERVSIEVPTPSEFTAAEKPRRYTRSDRKQDARKGRRRDRASFPIPDRPRRRRIRLRMTPAPSLPGLGAGQNLTPSSTV